MADFPAAQNYELTLSFRVCPVDLADLDSLRAEGRPQSRIKFTLKPGGDHPNHRRECDQSAPGHV